MNHWDLTPGETVVFARGDTAQTVKVRYRGRDTTHAFFCIAPNGDLFELDLLSDGSFRDAAGKRWIAEGADRNAKIVIEEPLGERRHFTRALKQKVRKAIA